MPEAESLAATLTHLLQTRKGIPVVQEDGKHVYTLSLRAGEVRARLPFARQASGSVIKADPEVRAMPEGDMAPEGKIRIRGTASSTSEDWYGTQMSPACLLMMQEQFSKGIGIFPSHGSWMSGLEWDQEMGRSVKAELEVMPKEGAEECYRLCVESLLSAKMPKCQELAERLEEKQPIGMSIGGWFLEIRYIMDEEEDEIEAIIVEKVELDHLAITRNPANPDCNDLQVLRSVAQRVLRAADKTDFPKKGDNKKISLANSEYPEFDRAYAEAVKDEYPSIWEEGGNTRGNEAFELWGRARNGDNAQEVLDWIKEREAWMARHFEDHLLAGVVAQVKWGGVGTLGESGMKSLIDEEKKKIDDKAEKAAAAPEDTRATTGYAELPLAEESEPWDWDTETQDAVLEEDNWSRYAKAHFWENPDADAKTKDAYKLPFAKMIGGTLKAVWKGVSAAMAALNGARGGVDIPSKDREDVYAHIKRYYARFEKEAPALKDLSAPAPDNSNQPPLADSARAGKDADNVESTMTQEEINAAIRDGIQAALRAQGIVIDPETPEQKIARLEEENRQLRANPVSVPMRRGVRGEVNTRTLPRTGLDALIARSKQDLGAEAPLVQAVERHAPMLKLDLKGRGDAVRAFQTDAGEILRDIVEAACEDGSWDVMKQELN